MLFGKNYDNVLQFSAAIRQNVVVSFPEAVGDNVVYFGWGSAPGPAGRAHSAPLGPLAGFKGPISKGREGRV